ncbi:MAG: acyl-ACP--UDP-N-acetylglucosamine O-acyltransferase [Desulfotalea sp.]
MSIHKTAVIDSGAELDSSVHVGPYAVIDGNVRIGADTRIEAHAVVTGHTTLGERNYIGSFATIGGPPQDISYKNEPTEVIIGNDNQIREYATVHRGTPENGKTVIGDNNMLMAYTHVAHDCTLENHIIMVNVATLGGHVHVGERASIGGLVAVHQFCRIGAYSYVGGLSGLSLDVPPFMMLSGTRSRARISGLNKIGLRRNGFSREVIAELNEAYKIIFRSPNLLTKDAISLVIEKFPTNEAVQKLVTFFRESKRGVIRRTLDEE